MYWNLNTEHLNEDQISAIQNELLKQIRHSEFGTWAAIPNDAKNVEERRARIELTRGLAIAAILADATYRHIVSSEEVLRVFIGHPGMFKVNYDKAAGKIKDSTFDIQKRIGGLISTGEDNIENLPNMPSEYTCAECKDYEVYSKSAVKDRLSDMFTEGQVRHVFGEVTGLWEMAYAKNEDGSYKHSIEELKSNTPKEKQHFISKAEEDGKKFAEAFDADINVADGASYITEEMCENMLRMRGAYNNKVKEAFDLLRSDKAYDWKRIRDAYKTIYDEVNLVTTKYTAYGFREHTVNGSTVSNTAIPYYNKFALFPLFKCIATGRMDGIYNKMRNEGVDMLLMTSAVKLGSQGAVKFDGTSINEPFNTYTQSYGFLRRQLNTDPEEGADSTLGTQMVKICL